MTPAIELRGVTKRFLTPSGGIYTALRDLDMVVEPGEFCAVVGPTGCGKSTTLALISGLEPASEGEVEVFGKPVNGIADGIGYVFQTDAVFPWKTVLENVAAGPRYRGASNRDARERARDWISRVGLSGFEDRYPYQLSGGMRKRVALGGGGEGGRGGPGAGRRGVSEVRVFSGGGGRAPRGGGPQACLRTQPPAPVEKRWTWIEEGTRGGAASTRTPPARPLPPR